MSIKKLLVSILTLLIIFSVMNVTNAEKKIKFDRKKLATVELIYSKPKLIPMMLSSESPENITILGKAEATQGQMIHFIEKMNPNPKLNCTVKKIVQLYYEEADREGIRPDIAICQALKETGFFGYGGDVSPSQNNYCGLGATGNKEPGAKFETPQLGVRAHIQHLLVYTSTNPPKVPIVDPRYEHVKNNRQDIFGKTIHWTDLNGRWAVPGTYYGQDILKLWRQALLPDDSIESLLAANRNINLNAPTAEMFTQRALIYFARGEKNPSDTSNYYSALQDFESASMLKSNSAEVLYNFAVINQILDQNEEAINIYDRVIAIDNEFNQAYYNRGHLKLLKGEYQSAIDDFNSSLNLEPINANAWNEIAIAHFKMKMYKEAYEDIQTAYRLNDRNEVVIANKNAIESCVKGKKK